MSIEDKIILIADSHLGRYIPQMIVENELNNENWDWSEISEDDIEALKEGPDNEWYWEAWDNALNSIKITFEDHTYTLIDNEDLWAIREDATEEEVEEWII